MIHWLSSWLREIVLIILLATFIDLLLPNSTMQRYVKVVISLFILMTILSPIISLFKLDLNLNQLSSEALIADHQTTNPNVKRFQPLNEIMREGEKLNAYNKEQTTEFVEGQIIEMMKAQLDKEMPGIVRSVAVNTDYDNETNQISIHHVQVILRSKAIEKENNTSNDSTLVIKPIDPVIIQIEFDQAKEAAVEKYPIDSSVEQDEKSQIYDILQKNWEISSQQLSVIYEKE